MSRRIRKQTIYICENKDADQVAAVQQTSLKLKTNYGVHNREIFKGDDVKIITVESH